jgi:hypothetical protein
MNRFQLEYDKEKGVFKWWNRFTYHTEEISVVKMLA